VFHQLANGAREEDIVGDFFERESADIRACLGPAAERERKTVTLDKVPERPQAELAPAFARMREG
jgi:hypothetical protein